MQVIARTAAAASFGEALAQQALAAGLVPEAALVPSPLPPRRVHEPGHPLADAQGFVSYPGVDTAAEMMTLLSATRAYEANVSAMNVARTLAMKSLDIGGNS
jgi:flagellar basal-body rod protein FlgC